MKIIFIYFLVFSSVVMGAPSSNCSTYSGSGICAADSTNGCHVPKSTICETTTPDGCRRIGCNGSCPSQGYYVPYGNATAWNAFKANIPSTMTNTACLVMTSSSSSSSSSTSPCTANGVLCQYNSGNSNCNSCCNAPVPGNGLIGCSGGSNSGITFAECGSSNSTTCLQDGSICTSSGGSCFDY